MIYLATFGMIFLDFVLADINDHELNFVANNDLSPIKFFCKKNGHSKGERKQLINLHLKHVFAGEYYSKPPPIPPIMAIIHQTSRDMSRDP